MKTVRNIEVVLEKGINRQKRLITILAEDDNEVAEKLKRWKHMFYNDSWKVGRYNAVQRSFKG